MKKKRPIIIFLLLVILVLGLTATTIYFYRKYNSVTLGNATAQKEINSLVSEVGKIMVLPENETPTIATVSDPAKLQNQAFFADAKTGDKVLIYSSAKKAILYDPKAKKIVNVAPINIGADATPEGTTTETTKAQ